MNTRSNALAARIEQGAEALATFVEGLTEAEWQTAVPNEQRPVSVLVHHVANLYSLEIDLAQQMASDKPVDGVTWDGIAQMNAQHAQDHAAVNQQETVQMLRDNSKAAADRVRAFTDEELDNAVMVSLYADAPLTAQFFIEDHALRHSFHHLANIKAVLNC